MVGVTFTSQGVIQAGMRDILGAKSDAAYKLEQWEAMSAPDGLLVGLTRVTALRHSTARRVEGNKGV
jgi:hypothetical protein